MEIVKFTCSACNKEAEYEYKPYNEDTIPCECCGKPIDNNKLWTAIRAQRAEKLENLIRKTAQKLDELRINLEAMKLAASPRTADERINRAGELAVLESRIEAATEDFNAAKYLYIKNHAAK